MGHPGIASSALAAALQASLSASAKLLEGSYHLVIGSLFSKDLLSGRFTFLSTYCTMRIDLLISVRQRLSCQRRARQMLQQSSEAVAVVEIGGLQRCSGESSAASQVVPHPRGRQVALAPLEAFSVPLAVLDKLRKGIRVPIPRRDIRCRGLLSSTKRTQRRSLSAPPTFATSSHG